MDSVFAKDSTFTPEDKEMFHAEQTPWAFYYSWFIGYPNELRDARPVSIINKRKRPSDSGGKKGQIRAYRQGKKAYLFHRSKEKWRCYTFTAATAQRIKQLESLVIEPALIKIGLHAARQQMGNLPSVRQTTLLAALETRTSENTDREYKTRTIGLNFSPGQKRALFAIQKLLDKTNYQGDIKEELEIQTASGLKIREPLPLLEIRRPEYLEAYGLKKKDRGRGKMEFHRVESKQALRDFESLSKLQGTFVWERWIWPKRKKGKKGEPRIDRIQIAEPIIKIIRGWHGLTEEESKLLDQGQEMLQTNTKLKPTFTVIRPSLVLVDQIDNYFALKRPDYLDEIKRKAPRASKYVYNLVDWSIDRAEQKRRRGQSLILKISREILAHRLWMHSWIEKRQWSRISAKQDECLRIAKDTLGYVLRWEAVPGNETGSPPGMLELELDPARYAGFDVRKLTPEEQKHAEEIDEWLNRENARGQNEHGTKNPWGKKYIENQIKTHGDIVWKIYCDTALGTSPNAVEFYRRVRELTKKKPKTLPLDTTETLISDPILPPDDALSFEEQEKKARELRETLE